MTGKYFARTFMAIFMSLGVLSYLGCDPELSSRDVSPAASAQSEPREILTAYIHALQSNNTAAVDLLISTELRDRIEMRASGADFESNLQLFVSHERENLIRSIAASESSKPFTVVVSEMSADESVAAISLAINGYAVPKPFYFVMEDSGYKLNIVKPDLARSHSEVLEGNTYVVKNDDGVSRSFSCSGAGASTVAAGQTLNKFCTDACGFFDGTVFTVNGASASCDFNTFGIDMFIRNNSPVCAGRC